MLRILSVISAVLLFSACASQGEQTAARQGGEPGTELVASADAKQAEEDVVCRRERKTGSNMAKTVCYTREALEKLEEDSQRNLRDYQNRAASPTANN